MCLINTGCYRVRWLWTGIARSSGATVQTVETAHPELNPKPWLLEKISEGKGDGEGANTSINTQGTVCMIILAHSYIICQEGTFA